MSMVVAFFRKETCSPRKKKIRTFLSLYTNAHLWVCIKLEKRGGRAHIRNGSKV